MRVHAEYLRLEAEYVKFRADATKAIQDKDAEVDELEHCMKDLEGELSKIKLATEVHQRCAETARRDQMAAKELLARRTAELEAAQAFMSPIETVTDTHIVELVRELNYEATQLATTLAEFYEGRASKNPSRELLDNIPSTIRRAQIPSIASRLARIHPNDATTNLQIVLQLCLAHLAEINIHSWRFGWTSGGLNDVFRELRNDGMSVTYFTSTCALRVANRSRACCDTVERLNAQVCEEDCQEPHGARRRRRARLQYRQHGRCCRI
jgi:hypothetical protein